MNKQKIIESELSEKTDKNKNEIEKPALFKVNKKDYGDKFQDHLLEQYKQCLTLADKVSDRRLTTNSYLLTLNVAIMAFAGTIVEKSISPWVFLAIGFTDIIICVVWIILIKHSHDLNREKFIIINEMEGHLPTTPFTLEHSRLDKNNFRASSLKEIIIPSVFIVLSIFLFFYGFCNLIIGK